MIATNSCINIVVDKLLQPACPGRMYRCYCIHELDVNIKPMDNLNSPIVWQSDLTVVVCIRLMSQPSMVK